MKRYIALLLSLLLIINLSNSVSVKRTELLDNWTMEVVSGNEKSKSLQGKKFNTSLPTTIHLDLHAHK